MERYFNSKNVNIKAVQTRLNEIQPTQRTTKTAYQEAQRQSIPRHEVWKKLTDQAVEATVLCCLIAQSRGRLHAHSLRKTQIVSWLIGHGLERNLTMDDQLKILKRRSQLITPYLKEMPEGWVPVVREKVVARIVRQPQDGQYALEAIPAAQERLPQKPRGIIATAIDYLKAFARV